MHTTLIEYYKEEIVGLPLLAAILFNMDIMHKSARDNGGSQIQYHNGGFSIHLGKAILEGEMPTSPFSTAIVVDGAYGKLACTPNTGMYLENRNAIDHHYRNFKYTTYRSEHESNRFSPIPDELLDYFRTILKSTSANPGDHTIIYDHIESTNTFLDKTVSIRIFNFNIYNLVTVSIQITDHSGLNLLSVDSRDELIKNETLRDGLKYEILKENYMSVPAPKNYDEGYTEYICGHFLRNMTDDIISSSN